VQTRRQADKQRATAAANKPASHGRTQTGRTAEQQAQHRASYKVVHKQRSRESYAAAKAALEKHMADVRQPLVAAGPDGQFTPCQLLTYEFADSMDEVLPADVLTRAPVSINSSCVQRFNNMLTKPVGKAPSDRLQSCAAVRNPPFQTLSCCEISCGRARSVELSWRDC